MCDQPRHPKFIQQRVNVRIVIQHDLNADKKSGISEDVARERASDGVLVDRPLRARGLPHRHPLYREYGLRRTFSPTQTGDDFSAQPFLLQT